jgi:hypothetical protein
VPGLMGSDAPQPVSNLTVTYFCKFHPNMTGRIAVGKYARLMKEGGISPGF